MDGIDLPDLMESLLPKKENIELCVLAGDFAKNPLRIRKDTMIKSINLKPLFHYLITFPFPNGFLFAMINLKILSASELSNTNPEK